MSRDWGLAAWWRLLRDWDDYFGRSIQSWEWPETYEPELADGSKGKTVMKHWGVWGRGRWSAQLHWFVGVEPGEPFHTHQARWGIRAILFGSYIEAVRAPDGRISYRRWRKGMVGIIPAKLDHCIVHVAPEGAISLWIRGPTTNDVRWTFPDGTVRILRIAELI